ncbi:MAG: hypothetical protein Q7S52_03155 [bacterium]|nr:hypothetical protein [bacterium]
MKPFFPKKFLKRLKKRSAEEQEKFYEAIALFVENAHHPLLRNHRLRGRYAAYRSIDVTGNLRAVYKEFPGNIARFSAFDTHHQLYGT